MAKFAHILEAIREKNPTFFNKTTDLIERFSAAAQRYEATLKRVEASATHAQVSKRTPGRRGDSEAVKAEAGLGHRGVT